MPNVVMLDGKEVNPMTVPGIRFHFCGNNSLTKLCGYSRFKGCTFELGEDCHIDIGDNCYITSLNVDMSGGGTNKRLTIGNKFHISSGSFAYVNERDIAIEIGDNCLFGSGIVMRATDGHIIYDMDTMDILNKSHVITVSDHVWVCANVTILKNSFIARDCVIGTNATVSGKFDTPNTVICGNPARVVRSKINWCHGHIV